jgi:hypothetical protein
MDNPLIYICGLALCWPAPLPLLVLGYVLNRYSVRVAIAPKAKETREERAEKPAPPIANDEV